MKVQPGGTGMQAGRGLSGPKSAGPGVGVGRFREGASQELLLSIRRACPTVPISTLGLRAPLCPEDGRCHPRPSPETGGLPAWAPGSQAHSPGSSA